MAGLAIATARSRSGPLLPIAGAIAFLAAGFVIGTVVASTPAGAVLPSASPLVAGATPQPSSSPSIDIIGGPDIQAAIGIQQLPQPPGHPRFVIVGTADRGQVVLFQDFYAHFENRLFVERPSGVEEIHLAGDNFFPIRAKVSPSGTFAVIQQSGRLYRYDMESGVISGLPSSPGDHGIEDFTFESDRTLAVVEALKTTFPGRPTQLWRLDLVTRTWTAVGEPATGMRVFATTRGLMIAVDTNPSHDNLGYEHFGWHVYLLGADGKRTSIYATTHSTDVSISPDGRWLVRTDTNTAGVWLVNLERGTEVMLSHVGRPGLVEGWRAFSPDSRYLAIDDSADGISIRGTNGSWMLDLSPGIGSLAWIPPFEPTLQPRSSP